MKNILLPFALTFAVFNTGFNLGLMPNTGDRSALNLTDNSALAQDTGKWSSQQLGGAQKNCASAAMKSAGSKVTMKVANAYCECALGSASRRYEYADFAKNERKYTEQLTKEGVIKKCAQTAQAAK
jgi:hypothetical protein